MPKSSERFVWDVTTALESLGAADIVLWTWEPERDRLRMIGSARPLGLGPLTPECSSAALLALAMPQDRETTAASDSSARRGGGDGDTLVPGRRPRGALMSPPGRGRWRCRVDPGG